MTSNTPDPPSAQKPRHDATWFAAACRHLWPGRHAAGLAAFTNRPKSTCRAWIAGYRRPPPSAINAVLHRLRNHASEGLSIAAFLETVAVAREREPRRLTGWAAIAERDGPGTVPRDGRWRGGRSKT